METATPTAATDVKISGRKVKERFFTQVPSTSADAAGDALKQFRCQCGKVRLQNTRFGYTNLKQHVMLKHPEWIQECADDLVAGSGSTSSSSSIANGNANANANANATSPRRRTTASGGKIKATEPVLLTPPEAAVDIGQQLSLQQQEEQEPTAVATATATTAIAIATATASASGKRKSMEQAEDDASNDNDDTEDDERAAPRKVQRTRTDASDTDHKREGYLSWDDYFMSVAFLSAMRSKDPSTQVGACIVNDEQKIVGIGYNGFPRGCSDDVLPWARKGDPLDTKYPYVCHAEMNAILNKNASDIRGCTLYVALFPCNECAKLIIQSGIRQVVFHSDKYHNDWKFVASRRLLEMANVELRQYRLKQSSLVIDFSTVE